jgi:hypothetical protein
MSDYKELSIYILVVQITTDYLSLVISISFLHEIFCLIFEQASKHKDTFLLLKVNSVHLSFSSYNISLPIWTMYTKRAPSIAPIFDLGTFQELQAVQIPTLVVKESKGSGIGL